MALLAFTQLIPNPTAANAIIRSPTPRNTHSCSNYPDISRRLAAEGVTTLAFTVTDQGAVASPVIAQSSGDKDLDAAAIACIRHWTYNPATRSGTPVAIPRKAAVRWKLERGSPDRRLALGKAIITRPHTCTDPYPPAAQHHNIEGTATIAFTITTRGIVANPVIDRSSGDRDLDAASIACVRRWTYRPTRRDGNLVSIPWKAAVQWKLDDPVDRHVSLFQIAQVLTLPALFAAFILYRTSRYWKGAPRERDIRDTTDWDSRWR